MRAAEDEPERPRRVRVVGRRIDVVPDRGNVRELARELLRHRVPSAVPRRHIRQRRARHVPLARRRVCQRRQHERERCKQGPQQCTSRHFF